MKTAPLAPFFLVHLLLHVYQSSDNFIATLRSAP